MPSHCCVWQRRGSWLEYNHDPSIRLVYLVGTNNDVRIDWFVRTNNDIRISSYVGANNNAGTPAAFRAATVGWMEAGASLTAPQEAAEYAALQSFMTVLGANV